MKRLLILFAMLLIFPQAFAGEDKTQTIDMEFWGSLLALDDFGRGAMDVTAKGTPGKANGRGVGKTGLPVMYAELPGGNGCVDFSPGPSGVYIVEAQMVMTFDDGSMIWANSPPTGYVCFSGFVFAPYDIMGGIGRFEGATGWIEAEIDSYGFGPSLPRLVTPETGIMTGEIILP